MAILLKAEFLLVIIGGVFVLEALSVMAQVSWFKYTARTKAKTAKKKNNAKAKRIAKSKTPARHVSADARRTRDMRTGDGRPGVARSGAGSADRAGTAAAGRTFAWPTG